jgi:hypothetical protein
MIGSAGTLRLPRGWRPSADGLGGATLAMCALAALAGATAAAAPDSLRLLLFVAISAVLASLSLILPRAAVLATMSYLVVMALVRRLLIPVSPWSSFDPLLLIGPLIVTVLMIKLFLLERRPLAPDLLSKLVLAMLLLTVLQIGNPAGALGSSVAGFLFVGVPLMWFFVGRELASERFVRQLLLLLLAAGVVTGAYGLWQLGTGFPSWDRAWTEIAVPNGLSSLSVNGVIRAFGTVSSFLEYALVLASALVVAAGLVIQGRALPLLALPLLTLALFLSSSRGPLVTALLAVIVMLALHPRRPGRAAVIVVVALIAAFGLLKVVGEGGGGGSALVSHQVNGLANPLDPGSSTLLIHVSLVVDGVRASFSRPLGSGTGSTNQAGSKLGGIDTGAAPTEVDVSNAFVGLGLPGGLLYLAVVVGTLFAAVRGYFAGHDLLLPTLGVLIVGLGQWLSGGHWFLAPATWLLIGWVAATALPRAASARTPVGPPSAAP